MPLTRSGQYRIAAERFGSGSAGPGMQVPGGWKGLHICQKDGAVVKIPVRRRHPASRRDQAR